MKRVVLAVILSLCLSVCAFAAEAANIANVTIYPVDDEDGPFIIHGDSTTEKIRPDYIGLFINGSIMKSAEVFNEDGRIILPLRTVAEGLGARVDWDSAVRKITVTDGEATIELFADKAAVIINDRAYVSTEFISDTFGADVSYSDGDDRTKPYIVVRIPHVMISRYPADAVRLSEREAVEIVREQLIIAFERRFGEYIPLAPGVKLTYADGGDEALMRSVISNLEVASENDRYYSLPVVFDFWCDKYTGEVYVFYNGSGMTITAFDPYAEGALAFAG